MKEQAKLTKSTFVCQINQPDIATDDNVAFKCDLIFKGTGTYATKKKMSQTSKFEGYIKLLSLPKQNSQNTPAVQHRNKKAYDEMSWSMGRLVILTVQ